MNNQTVELPDLKHAILMMYRVLMFTACVVFSISVNADEGSSFTAHRDIHYTIGHLNQQQSLDIYTPDLATNTHDRNKRPVHVYVHGGAWTAGDKSNISVEQIQAYTDRGIILVSVNYRLGPDHKYPANIQDIVSASEWLRENISDYGGDVNNMVLSGHSAGAHLVALLGVGTPDAPNMVSADIYKAIIPVDTGSYDLTRPAEGEGAILVNIQRRRVFGTAPSVLERASPIVQIESGVNYSTFDLYVTRERDYAVSETRRFKRALSASAHEVAITVIRGGVSHSEMKEAMFDPEHLIFRRIIGQFR